MSAAEKSVDVDSNPRVVILANDLERFNGFAAFLSKNGFSCEVFNNIEYAQFDSYPVGTVFYVSFNFNATAAVSVAQDLEQRLHMTCIVFAESDDFQTAAKLSSAKMTQTLQHPYTQKNFLMGLQTIVKKRKVDQEKELRRQNHQRHDPNLEMKIDEPEQITKFTKEDAKPKSGVIIQEGVKTHATSSTLIHGEAIKTHQIHQQGDAVSVHSIHQKGTETKSHFAISKGEPTSSYFAIQHSDPLAHTSKPLDKPQGKSVAPKKSSEGEQKSIIHQQKSNIEIENAENELPAHTLMKNSTEGSTMPSAATRQPINWERLEQNINEQLANNLWAIIGVCFIGTLICFYCLYQMILMGR